jgi:uncharacterized protein involved in outer membrane biogenesis
LGPTKFSASGTLNETAKPATVDLKLKTQDSSITELAKLAGALGVAFSPDYKIDGKLSVDLAAKGQLTAPELNGQIKARDVSASGGEIKEPVSTPEIDLTMTPQSIVSNNFTAKSGSTAVNLAFTATNYTSKNPTLDATLRANNAQIAELLNIAKAYGVDSAKGMTGSGQISIDVHAHGQPTQPNTLVYAGSANVANANLTTPELTKPVAIRSANAQFSQNSVSLTNLNASVASSTLTGNLSASNFAAPNLQFALAADKIDTDELQNLVKPTPPGAAPAKARNPTPANEPSLLTKTSGGGTLSVKTLKAQEIVLSNVNTKVQLDHGLITLSPLTAGTFGGTVAGSMSADMRPNTPPCTLKAKLTGIDANALLSAVSTMKNELYGSLNANSDLKFALTSSSQLAQTLNGTLSFALSNGELKNVNILNEISKVGKFLNAGGGSSSSTALKQFSGTLNIANGVANTNDLKAVLDTGSLAANGSLNLANQGINMHMTAVLASGASKTVGGTGVGGMLNTVMANNKGELVVPVLVTGSTSHMIFAPDVQAMAKMKLNGLLPTSGDPAKGAVGSLVQGILGGQKQNQNNQQQKQQSNPLNSILDQFKKKQ